MSIDRSSSEPSALMLLALMVGSIALGFVWTRLSPSWMHELDPIVRESWRSLDNVIDVPFGMWSIHTVLSLIGRVASALFVTALLCVSILGNFLFFIAGVFAFYALVSTVVSRLKYSAGTLKRLAIISAVTAAVPLAFLISGYFSYHPPVFEERAGREWGEYISLLSQFTLAGVMAAFLFLAGKLYDKAIHEAQS